jgi:hypothetical protein
MPILDAIQRLCRGSDGEVYARAVRERAPGWLAETLVGAPASGPPRKETRASMLRHLAGLVEGLAATRPLALIVEDLHWSDASTVDLIGFLAQRTEPAALLVIGTFRPEDAGSAAHPVLPLARELARKGLAATLSLGGLAAEDAALLVAERLGGGSVAPALAARLVERTGGNPFLLRELADHLRQRGFLREERGAWRAAHDLADAEVPDGVLAAIDPRIDRLASDERAALEAASVLGAPIHAESLAAVLGGDADAEVIEATCERLARRGEILERDSGFRFRHALYEQAFLRRIPVVRRARLHERAARALEASGSATPAQLAHHCARAGASERALAHYAEAILVAKQRFADQEVALLCAAALEQVAALPEGAARSERELALELERGAANLAVHGYTGAEQARSFGRVCELAERLELPVLRLLGTGGLFMHHLGSGDVRAGTATAARLLELAAPLAPPFRMVGRTAMGVALFNAGDLLGALAHLEAEDGADPIHAATPVDLAVYRLGALAKTRAHLGSLDRAREAIRAAVAQGGVSGRPFDLANAHRMAAELYGIIDEPEAAADHAERTRAICREYGYPQIHAIGDLFAGWALARAGDAPAGLAAIGAAIRALDGTGYRLTLSAFRMREAEAAVLAGEPDAALRAADLGLEHAERSGELRHRSDLLRLRGLALRLGGAEAEGVGALRSAREVAAERGAVLLELRALLVLAEDDAASRAALRAQLATHPHALPERERAAAARLAA